MTGNSTPTAKSIENYVNVWETKASQAYANGEEFSIYLDTCVFIYLLDKSTEFYDRAYALFSGLEKAKVMISTSNLTITELFANKSLEKHDELYQDYIDFILGHDYITTLDYRLDTALKAAEIMRASGLRFQGAAHLATAGSYGVKWFVTNDTEFRRVSGGGNPEILLLKDMYV